MEMKQTREGKERNHGKQKEKDIKGKEGNLGKIKNGVCAPYSENALLATIQTCPLKISSPLASPLKKAGAATALKPCDNGTKNNCKTTMVTWHRYILAKRTPWG